MSNIRLFPSILATIVLGGAAFYMLDKAEKEPGQAVGRAIAQQVSEQAPANWVVMGQASGSCFAAFKVPELDSPLFVSVQEGRLPRNYAVIRDDDGKWIPGAVQLVPESASKAEVAEGVDACVAALKLQPASAAVPREVFIRRLKDKARDNADSYR